MTLRRRIIKKLGLLNTLIVFSCLFFLRGIVNLFLPRLAETIIAHSCCYFVHFGHVLYPRVWIVHCSELGHRGLIFKFTLCSTLSLCLWYFIALDFCILFVSLFQHVSRHGCARSHRGSNSLARRGRWSRPSQKSLPTWAEPCKLY